MFDIGLPELMVILLLGLVLLGPDRLPGVIRQVTGVIRQLRSSYGDALAVFKDQLGDVQEDIDAIRGEISSIQGEVRSTAEDVEKDVKKVQGEVKTAGAEIQQGLDETAKEAAEVAGTRPDQAGAEANAPPAVAAIAAARRPAPSERGPAWTPQGAQGGGGSPLQQDLFAGLMRSLKARLGEDWLVEQADIYRDMGARAAQRAAGAKEDTAELARTWADMHRNTLPEGSLQIIETGRDYRVRMRQCPFGFADSDDAALCQSCGVYDLAFLAERAAEVKWESHLTAGDPWCELVFAKPPPPQPEVEGPAADTAAAVNGDTAPGAASDAVDAASESVDAASKSADAASKSADGNADTAPETVPASPAGDAGAGSEFAALAQAYGSAAEPEDAAVDAAPEDDGETAADSTAGAASESEPQASDADTAQTKVAAPPDGPEGTAGAARAEDKPDKTGEPVAEAAAENATPAQNAKTP